MWWPHPSNSGFHAFNRYSSPLPMCDATRRPVEIPADYLERNACLSVSKGPLCFLISPSLAEMNLLSFRYH
jgi:hypothetical protein